MNQPKDEMKQEAVVPAPPRDGRSETGQRVRDVAEWARTEFGIVSAEQMNDIVEALHEYAARFEVVPRADEQDARRYRWLRERVGYWYATPKDADCDPELVDAQIDAAMGDTHAG